MVKFDNASKKKTCPIYQQLKKLFQLKSSPQKNQIICESAKKIKNKVNR